MSAYRPGLLSGYMQRQRIAAALPYLSGQVLDIGVGTGRLAEHVPADRYSGWDINAGAVAAAAKRYPTHMFSTTLPMDSQFDTVVALAVVEHIPEPVAQAVRDWTDPLKHGGRLVLTTPHRAFRRVHEAGARLGLATSSAADEHETLFTRSTLVEALSGLPLYLDLYRRFLFGMNQVFVFTKR